MTQPVTTHRNPGARDRSRCRPWTGIVLAVIAALHLAGAPLFYGDALRSILDAGVIASVEADPGSVALRSAGFWYLTTGLSLVVLSAIVIWVEQRVGTLPRVLPWLLLGIAVWGILLVPASGFWSFLPAAAVAFVAARRGSPIR